MLLGYVLNKNTPYSEIQGPRILLQIYPFFSEIVDEGGVISSLTLHPPGYHPAFQPPTKFTLFVTVEEHKGMLLQHVERFMIKCFPYGGTCLLISLKTAMH